MDRSRPPSEPELATVRCVGCGHLNDGEALDCTECGTSLVLVTEETTVRDAPSFWSASGLPPVEEALDYAPGQVFASRYVIIDQLGQGGMGVVYKARDRELNRVVALKMIRPSLTDHPESLERFRREPGLAQQVTHENVCRVHDLGVDGSVRYLSMEYLDANTLLDILAKLGRLSVAQTIAIVAQVAAGLEAIHERGIVHRDLKPSNIALDRTRRAVVMDFGLARGPVESELTEPGAMVGSYAYLSPEQVQGRDVTFSADLYALGLVLFEMLTGQRPPGDPEDQRPLALRGEGAPCPPPSALAPEVPEALDAIVLSCLRWEPGDRPASAASVREALEACAVDVALPRRRRPRALRARSVAALALGTTLVLAVVLWRPWSPAPPGERGAVHRVSVAPFTTGNELEASAGLAEVGADAFEGALRQMPNVAIDAPGRSQLTVLGGVATEGSETSWDVALEDAAGRTRWRRELTGSSPLDELRVLTRELLDERFRTEATPALPDLATDSLDAYRDYLRARALHDGWYASELSELEKARQLYQDAIRADPEFALAHAGQALSSTGVFLTTRSEGDRAVAQYAAGRAVTFGDELAESHLALGTYLASVEDWDGASRELGRAFDLAPYDDRAMRRVADLFDLLGRPSDAHEIYRRALSERPESWENYYWYGRSLFDAGELDEAPVHLAKAIELNSEAEGPHTLLGFFHLNAGDLAQARRYYERAHALSDDLYSRRALGLVAYYSGDYPTALRYWESATELEPGVGILHAEVGDALRQLGRDEDARGHYLRALELLEGALAETPNDVERAAERAQVLAAMGRCGVAREAIEGVLDTHGHNTQLQYYGALTAGRCGEIDWAVSLVLPALGEGQIVGIEYDPDLADVRADPRVARPLQLIGFGERR